MQLYTWSVLIGSEPLSLSAEAPSLKQAREHLNKVVNLDYSEDEAKTILQAVNQRPPAQVLAKATRPAARVSAGQPRKLVWGGTAIALIAGAVIVGLTLRSGAGESVEIYQSGSWQLRWILWGIAIAAAFAVFCIMFGIHFLRTGDAPDAKLWRSTLQVWKVCLLAPWVILPPIWFSVEYSYLYPRPAVVEAGSVPSNAAVGDQLKAEIEKRNAKAEERKEKLEYFSKVQENSSKVWLALVTLLTGLYFGKEFGGKSES